jgi:hypothetical protein
MPVSSFFQVTAFVVLLFSSALNIAAAIKLTGSVDKVDNIFCIENPSAN